MSMTAYDTLVSAVAHCRFLFSRARARLRAARAREREDREREKRDTRPSGERESGSYSGTRQRNRIQFGPS